MDSEGTNRNAMQDASGRNDWVLQLHDTYAERRRNYLVSLELVFDFKFYVEVVTLNLESTRRV